MANMKFIRVHGRIVPLREKTYISKKTVHRGVGTRALSGAKTGAKFGATLGAIGGFLTPASLPKRVVNAGLGAVDGAFNWSVIGAGLGAVFGKRKGQVSVVRKKIVGHIK